MKADQCKCQEHGEKTCLEQSKHTPTPWHVAGYGILGPKAVLSDQICVTMTNRSTREREANATFIVLAVNNFERAIRYLEIEHRKEKEDPHHDADCDLCEFIAKGKEKKETV